MFKHVSAAAILLYAISPANGDLLNYIEQIRSVSSSASASSGQGSDSDQDSIHAPDFGLFDADVFASADAGAAAWAGASQISSMDAAGIRGLSTNLSNAFGYPGGSSGSTARSYLSVTFELTASADFTLSGYYEIGSDLFSGASARVRFDGPDGSIIDRYSDYPVWEDLLETGRLSPGTYTLLIDASSGANAGEMGESTAHVGYNIELQIPEPHALLQLLFFAALSSTRRL